MHILTRSVNQQGVHTYIPTGVCIIQGYVCTKHLYVLNRCVYLLQMCQQTHMSDYKVVILRGVLYIVQFAMVDVS